MTQAESGNQNAAGTLVLVGGILAIAAGFLEWMTLDPAEGSTTTFKGTDLSAGTGALGLGVILVIFGIILLVRGRATGGKGSSVTAIVLAAILLIAGAYSAFAPGKALAKFEASDVADQLGISDELAEVAIEQGIESQQIEVSAKIGAYVATAGGVLALLGGIAGAVTAGRIRRQRATAAPTAATTTATAPPAP